MHRRCPEWIEKGQVPDISERETLHDTNSFSVIALDPETSLKK
jgi:hypothetical protein